LSHGRDEYPLFLDEDEVSRQCVAAGTIMTIKLP